MTLEITKDTHLDHVTAEHFAWLRDRFKDKEAFFIETVELPEGLSPLPCGLFGPTMGDEPVAEEDVTYVIRGARKCASRVVAREPRMTRTLTVIGGPDDEGRPCVLYTCYGGPSAPREPGDKDLPSWEEVQKSRAFWKDHALAAV